MLEPSTPTVADCPCPTCRRAAALDAMRHISAARASASRVPAVADPWHEPDQLPFIAGLRLGLPLSVGTWLALAFAAGWLLAWLT